MAAGALTRFGRGIWPMLALFALLLVSLSFMSDATHNSQRFDRLYSVLLLTNTIGLVVLAGLIGLNLYWLILQRRRHVPGAQLTTRLVWLFVVLAVLPVSVVYYFSLQSLQRGIDSWFDVNIEQSLQDALDLSRSAFDERLRDRLSVTRKLAGELTEVPAPLAPMSLFDLRVRSGASELTLLGENGRIIASSSIDSTAIVPNQPSGAVLLQVRQGGSYVGLDPIGDQGLHVRAVVAVPGGEPGKERRILQALYPVSERLADKANAVQQAYSRYRELSFLRVHLRRSYVLTLSLVLLLTLLSAVWAAFYLARRLVAPVTSLAEATRAVADGDYSRQLPVETQDEIGFLVQLFNMMTRRLAQARDEAQRSRQQIEGQRTYLETLLGSLSSGVMSLSPELRLRTVNGAAGQILEVSLERRMRASLAELLSEWPFLEPLFSAVEQHHLARSPQWSEQVSLFGRRGRQVLICRGARLPGEGHRTGGQVIVFDDVTALIQAQRDAAWGEVARRLAHEIKNPLTPIQLSAERLRRKYLGRLPPEDAEVLDRATHTIVQQVEAMKEMVNAFSEYARAPRMQPERVDLNQLLEEVLDLYREGGRNVALQTDLDETATPLLADPGRLRQVLHNLLKNALEAVEGRPDAVIRVSTRYLAVAGNEQLMLCIEDNGPGFTPEIYERLYEPYATTKTKGTGLGLAIVKRIVDEHGGTISAENRAEGGARVCIRLPVKAAGTVAHMSGGH